MDKDKLEHTSKRFSKNILFLQGVSFVLIFMGTIFATYFLKVELADQITSSVEGKVKRGDRREIFHTLSDVGHKNFEAVDLYDRHGQLNMTFPVQFRKDIPTIQKIWRTLSQSIYHKDIFFDKEGTHKTATIAFTWGHFQLFPVVLFTFILGNILSYPFLRRHKRLLLDSLEKESLENKNQAIEELARQVRHDYRSPLTALGAVANESKSIDENERKILLVAYNRMMGMLKDLSPENIQSTLKNGRGATKANSLTHIYSSILNVIEEQKIRLEPSSVFSLSASLSLPSSSPEDSLQKEDSCQKLESIQEGKTKKLLHPVSFEIQCSEDNKRAHVLISSVEFQRVISNLVKNSMESIEFIETIKTIENVETIESISSEQRQPGSIQVHIQVKESTLFIVIKDNGCGIPREFLEKVRERGFSFGKPQGEGLGLYSSIKKIETWGGSLKIDSEEARGTSVTIELPRVVKPAWASTWMNLKRDTPPQESIENVVILDDDKSIHHILEQKLKDQSYCGPIFKFTQGRHLITSLHKFKKKHTLSFGL